ncbi:transposase [Rothia terrae]|uniref:Transposase n=1 Tax=Rothia terrae TaxID=396015 RepID=A0A7S6WWC9_9MICC|nr:transposase [Rothia terrae]QOW64699.1 transposase [Rothia terrae]
MKGIEMIRPRKTNDPEFRLMAVKMVIDNNQQIASVARELGINENTLGRWVLRYRIMRERNKDPKLDSLFALNQQTPPPAHWIDQTLPWVEDRGESQISKESQKFSMPTELELLQQENRILRERNKTLLKLLVQD